MEYVRGTDKQWISIEDIIHGQTFPEDYDFVNKTYRNVGYICGMSVPPVMIKRIVQRLIESEVFK
jgi:DNA (cytosine-5)-methyltransferase 1